MNIDILDVSSSIGNIKKIILENDHQMRVELYSFGASIYQIYIDSKPYCVVPSKLDDFLLSSLYYGKTVGRMSGRISTKPFAINQINYQVNAFSSKDFQLHGGKHGFSFQNFQITKTDIGNDFVSIVLTYVSKDLEEGYPGELTLNVTYTLFQNQTLSIKFNAKTTQDTVANFTNHAYFNLLGSPQSITDHYFLIPSSHYIDRSETYEYRGIKKVDEKFDYRSPKQVKKYLNSFEESNPGYDHTFLLDSDEPIVIDHEDSLYALEVTSDYQSVVFFTHNLENKALSDQFSNFGRYSSFAVECQHAPGGTHHKELTNLILKKDEEYHHFINYHFNKK